MQCCPGQTQSREFCLCVGVGWARACRNVCVCVAVKGQLMEVGSLLSSCES